MGVTALVHPQSVCWPQSGYVVKIDPQPTCVAVFAGPVLHELQIAYRQHVRRHTRTPRSVPDTSEYDRFLYLYRRMSTTYAEVLSAFQPAKEISDPRRFSGRREQLIAGTQLLLAGDHVFIYGSRGIGKSSLAKQLEVIAAGNAQLLRDVGSPLADESFDFATCFIRQR